MSKSNLVKNMQTIASFALPISANNLMFMCANFVSMLFVARIGKIALAAGALAVTNFMTVMTIVATIFYAVSILTSHAQGQGKTAPEIGAIANNSFCLALLMAIPAAMIAWHLDHILLWFHQDPRLIALCRSYFHYAAWLMFPSLFGAVIGQFYMGIGKPRVAFYTNCCALPLTIILSYGLVLGRLGLPRLALAGIPAATAIVQSIGCACLMLWLRFGKSTKSYAIFSNVMALDWKLCRNILTLGLPIGIQFGSEIAAMTVATNLMGYFGVAALAASQITSQYAMLIVMISLGLSQALSTLASKAAGAGNVAQIRAYLFAAYVILISFFTLVLLLFIFIPDKLMSAYINIADVQNTELIRLTTYFLLIAMCCTRTISSGLCIAILIGIITVWVGILLAYFTNWPIPFWISSFSFSSYLLLKMLN